MSHIIWVPNVAGEQNRLPEPGRSTAVRIHCGTRRKPGRLRNIFCSGTQTYRENWSEREGALKQDVRTIGGKVPNKERVSISRRDEAISQITTSPTEKAVNG